MLLLPITTPRIVPTDDLAKILGAASGLKANDILVISSKVIALTEGAMIDLSLIEPSAQAKEWSQQCGRSPAFCEAVIQETKRMNGQIRGACHGALLTELRPAGLRTGTILTANAGLDESNTEENTAVGWPFDAEKSAFNLRTKLEKMIGGRIGVIISDSCCHPRRMGVTAFALAVSGLDPLISQKGQNDIFGKPLTITTEAIADQLATAANMLMGNAGQSTPACIVQDHGFSMSDFTGWVDGIEPEEDLFKSIV